MNLELKEFLNDGLKADLLADVVTAALRILNS